jgi:hypothetical protein
MKISPRTSYGRLLIGLSVELSDVDGIVVLDKSEFRHVCDVHESSNATILIQPSQVIKFELMSRGTR